MADDGDDDGPEGASMFSRHVDKVIPWKRERCTFLDRPADRRGGSADGLKLGHDVSEEWGWENGEINRFSFRSVCTFGRD